MAIDLSQYKAIIFDMDGTLIDTMPSHLSAWKQTADKFNFPYDKEWVYSMGGMPTYKVALLLNDRYGVNINAREVANYKTATFGDFLMDGALIESTYQILKEYQGKKKMALGTGSNQINTDKLLAHHGLSKFLDAVVTSANVENHKPNPDTFLLAAQKIGIKPEHCVVFEDTYVGQQAAMAAGMDCILVADGQLVI